MDEIISIRHNNELMTIDVFNFHTETTYQGIGQTITQEIKEICFKVSAKDQQSIYFIKSLQCETQPQIIEYYNMEFIVQNWFVSGVKNNADFVQMKVRNVLDTAVVNMELKTSN